MNKIIEVAEKEIGTKECPKNSNKTKYGEWFGWDGVAWCGIFVSWCYAFAGKQLPPIGFTNGFAGVQTLIDYAKKHNLIVSEPKEGDIVVFDWNKDGHYDHVGIFKYFNVDNYFNTIEGNTSLGNDSNGGEVMLRHRHTSSVHMFIHFPVNN